MIAILKGTVTGLTDRGFMVESEGRDQPLLVRTQLPGKSLKLQIGDRVHVFGGPDSNGDWASSGAYKYLPNGEEVRVRINTSDPPDKDTPMENPSQIPKKPWWKFW